MSPGKSIFFTFISLSFFVLSAACSPFDFGLFGGGSSSDGTERDVDGKFALALGGVAASWSRIEFDEDFSDRTLDCSTEDSNLLDLEIPDGFDSFSEAAGCELIPLDVGLAIGSIVIDGSFDSHFQTITPPQKLIQILIGEAGSELNREATTDETETVKRSSVSLTGDALAAVIANRITLIKAYDSPSLFAADPDLFDSDPPTSEYEAVIEAEANGIYQFSPVDPTDVRHSIYLDAEEREDIADEGDLRAYDQAVASAAFIFSGDTDDPTNGAFGFRSPTVIQYQKIEEALLSGTTIFPSGVGTSDAQFPTLAPIQVLILPYIAPRADDDTIPSFIFIRARDEDEPAVTEIP